MTTPASQPAPKSTRNGPRSINLTPPAFDPANPNAARNAAAANEAMGRMDEALRRKATLLTEVMQALQVEGVSLKKLLTPVLGEEDAADFMERWKTADEEHSAAGNALLSATSGIPVVG